MPSIARIETNRKRSVQARDNNALKLINNFIHECDEVRALFDDASSASFDNLEPQHITNDFMSRLATYISELRTKRANKYYGLNSYIAFLSGAKMNILARFPDEAIPCLEGSTWSKIRRHFTKKVSTMILQSGQKLVSPHTPADDNDMKILGYLCIMSRNSDPKFTTFFHMINTLRHCTGRASECAQASYSNLRTIGSSIFKNVDVLQLHLNRIKTVHEQELSFFPHRDSLFLCFYFSMAYALVLCPFNSDYFFPMFEGLFGDGDESTEKKTASGISKKFNEILQLVYKLADEFLCEDEEDENFTTSNIPAVTDLTPGLSSHSYKKAAVNTMHTCVDPLSLTMRAGWQMRDTHTLFDYLTSTVKSDQQCALSLSGWVVQDHTGKLSGGIPPTFDGLSDQEKKQMNEFTTYLFYDLILQEKISRKILDILSANIIRFWIQFQSIVQTPLPEVPAVADILHVKHPFILRVLQAAEKANISEESLKQISVKVMDKFVLDNFAYMSFEEVKKRFPDRVMIDTRTLHGALDHMQSQILENTISSRKRDDKIIHLQSLIIQQSRVIQSNFQRIEQLILNRSTTSLPTAIDTITNAVDSHAELQDGDVAASPDEEETTPEFEISGSLPDTCSVELSIMFINWFKFNSDNFYESRIPLIKQKKKELAGDDKKKFTSDWNSVKTKISSHRWVVNLMNVFLYNQKTYIQRVYSAYSEGMLPYDVWLVNLHENASLAATEVSKHFMQSDGQHTVSKVNIFKGKMTKEEFEQRVRVPVPVDDNDSDVRFLYDKLLNSFTKKNKKKS